MMSANRNSQSFADELSRLGVRLGMPRRMAERALDQAGFLSKSSEVLDPICSPFWQISGKTTHYHFWIEFDSLQGDGVNHILLRSSANLNLDQGLSEIRDFVRQEATQPEPGLFFRRSERMVSFVWTWRERNSYRTLALSLRDGAAWQIEWNGRTTTHYETTALPGMPQNEAKDLMLRTQSDLSGTYWRGTDPRDRAHRRWKQCLTWKLDLAHMFFYAVRSTLSAGVTVGPIAQFQRLADHGKWYSSSLTLFPNPDDWQDAIVVRTVPRWSSDTAPDPWSNSQDALSELEWNDSAIRLGNRQTSESTAELIEGPFAYGALRTKTIFGAFPYVELYPVHAELKFDGIEVSRILEPSSSSRRRPPRSTLLAKHIPSGMEVSTRGYISPSADKLLKTLLAARVAARS